MGFEWMKSKESKNFDLWVSILMLPFFLALLLVGIFKVEECKFLFFLGPLGCALFHFRGKVWWKHWYSKIECIVWGIGWLIVEAVLCYYFFSGFSHA